MVNAPNKFKAADDATLESIANAVVDEVMVVIGGEDDSVLDFVKIIESKTLSAFPGFQKVGLDDLKAYAAAGQKAVPLLAKADGGVEILKAKLIEMLKNFRDAAANGTDAVAVFTEQDEPVVGEVPKEEGEKEVTEVDGKANNEVAELEAKVGESQAQQPAEVIAEAAAPAEEVGILQASKPQLHELQVIAAVKEFAEKNSSKVAVPVSETASLHFNMATNLLNMFNRFDYFEFNRAYTEVLGIVIQNRDDAFSNNRALQHVGAMHVSDETRAAYVSLLGFLTTAADAASDPELWKLIDVRSSFERHKNVFTPTARQNVSEFYQHVIK